MSITIKFSVSKSYKTLCYIHWFLMAQIIDYNIIRFDRMVIRILSDKLYIGKTKDVYFVQNVLKPYMITKIDAFFCHNFTGDLFAVSDGKNNNLIN